jgi:hypothetical protein
MAELVVRFDVRFNERWTCGLLAAAMFFAAVPELASESVTLTTYYPAPSGVYSQLITTGNSWLARDGGYVDIGNTNNNGFKLDVTGTANFSGAITAGNGITGAYGLIPKYAPWGAYGTGDGGAGIYNDGTVNRALMIGGNTSSGVRTVKIGLANTDNLDVSGPENVGGAVTVAGNVTLNSGATKGYLTINNTGTGCFETDVTQGPVCSPGYYATWTAGLNIQNSWQYQNRGGIPYIANAAGTPIGNQIVSITGLGDPGSGGVGGFGSGGAAPGSGDVTVPGFLSVNDSVAHIFCCPL